MAGAVAAKPRAQKATRRARGEGGLTQLKSGPKKGMWVGTVELPPDPITGKRVSPLKVRSMDHKTAMKKMNKAKSDLLVHGGLPTSGETVKQWMDYWIENICQVRPKAKAGYRTNIMYINASMGKVKLTALTQADVRKLEAMIVKSRGLSPTTAHHTYRVLAKALKDALRDGRVLRNVAMLVDPPRRAVPEVKVLTADQAIDVIESVANSRLGSRWAFALLTGFRQGECIGLEIERVDFVKNVIDMSWQLQRIAWRHGPGCDPVGEAEEGEYPLYACGRKRGTDCKTRVLDAPADWEHRYITGGLYWSRPKSNAGWRVVPMVEPLRSIMERRIAAALREPNPHGLVWTSDEKYAVGGRHSGRRILPLDGSPIDPSRDNKAWHAVLDAAGAPQIRLHDARHTAVTILYDLGIAETVIQDIVGQSSLSVTRGYRARSQTLLVEAMGALGGALSKRPGIAAMAGLEPPALDHEDDPLRALES